jgi:hypothetical protein
VLNSVKGRRRTRSNAYREPGIGVESIARWMTAGVHGCEELPRRGFLPPRGGHRCTHPRGDAANSDDRARGRIHGEIPSAETATHENCPPSRGSPHNASAINFPPILTSRPERPPRRRSTMATRLPLSLGELSWWRCSSLSLSYFSLCHRRRALGLLWCCSGS